MSTRHRSRGKSASYRGRRSIFPLLLILAALALLAVVLYRLVSPSTASEEPPPADPSASTGVVSSSEVSPPATSETTPVSEELPSLDEAPWYLTLANADHPLPDDWVVETAELPNGLTVDSRIYDALTAMLNDCKAEGLSPIVCSAYRTIQKQTELFEAKINTFMRDGLSYGEAYSAASEVVAIPGTSEHNLGLAVDICATDYQILDDAQAETAEQKWLMEHCAEYGFILRYPKGKESVTGIIWEPWHYRYVGVELAQEIMSSGLCLEEYLAQHYSGV